MVSFSSFNVINFSTHFLSSSYIFHCYIQCFLFILFFFYVAGRIPNGFGWKNEEPNGRLHGFVCEVGGVVPDLRSFCCSIKDEEDVCRYNRVLDKSQSTSLLHIPGDNSSQQDIRHHHHPLTSSCLFTLLRQHSYFLS